MRCRHCRASADPHRLQYADRLSFGNWVIHQLIEAQWPGHRPGSYDGRLVEVIWKIGFLDAKREGGEMFWRWDFWNATMAREIRELRRRER